mgnify:CR=1 FL=1
MEKGSEGQMQGKIKTEEQWKRKATEGEYKWKQHIAKIEQKMKKEGEEIVFAMDEVVFDPVSQILRGCEDDARKRVAISKEGEGV